MKTHKAIIIGGGIGGLCAAIALQQANIEVEIYERSDPLSEVGAGLSLWSNAVKALQALGQHSVLEKLAIEDDHGGGILTQHGRALATMSMHEVKARYGAMMLVVHRAEFHAALRQNAPVIHTGATLSHFTTHKDGVQVYFTDGRCREADFLIGADGIRSAVRQQLFPHSQPRYSGYTAWRGIVAFDPTRVQQWGEFWGRGQRFGITPLNQERIYWFATENAPAGKRQDGQMAQHLLTLFGDWYAPIREIIAATDPTQILHHDLYDIDPLPTWTRGRVTLLGDAAHAMTPNLGQGACQAIEDAVVLQRCLQATTDVDVALRQYEQQRIPRTTQIMRLSRLIGRMGQWENTLMCTLRDFVMGSIPSGVRMKQFDPILGYDSTRS